jgi:hypothetical protein
MGAMAMTYKLCTRKQLAFIIVIVALACAAPFLPFGLTLAQPSPNVALGDGWQCSKLFLMTSCTKVVRAAPAPDLARNAVKCGRRA